MITTCTECKARYQLDTEKIPPRVIKVRCPACGGVFSLDGSLAKHQAVTEEVQPQQEPLVIQRGPGEFSPSAADERPAARVQTDAVSKPQSVPEPAAPEPEAVAPAATAPVASEPTVSEPAVSEPATGVAVMDRPARSGSRRMQRSKEEMLARALVSDIMVYNRDLYDKAKEEGNLLEALGAEIKKSWELYKEKVTPELANSSNHFRDALNEILADGENIF
jgi:predicted Zn finger-like uncharacterized protein